MTVSREWQAVPDTPLLQRILRPYSGKNCIYLTHFAVDDAPTPVSSCGKFSIPESCYIDDTGHFNAAEFVICYNQLMYCTLGTEVARSNTNLFPGWTLEDWWTSQLPDVLISHVDMQFKRPINSAEFWGKFHITEIRTHRIKDRMLKLRTTAEFGDADGGQAWGSIDLALVNLPAAHVALASQPGDAAHAPQPNGSRAPRAGDASDGAHAPQPNRSRAPRAGDSTGGVSG